jgi:dipeptidase E
MTDLEPFSFNINHLDLKKYFGKSEELKQELEKNDIIYIRGGNTFVLRQAMKLSGFDNILKELIASNSDMIYSGYSAGICILAPSLKGLEIIDDPAQKPYGNDKDVE